MLQQRGNNIIDRLILPVFVEAGLCLYPSRGVLEALVNCKVLRSITKMVETGLHGI